MWPYLLRIMCSSPDFICKPAGSFIKCPKCRVKFRVPASGRFPTAFAIKSLVSHFKQEEAAHPSEDKMNVNMMDICSACHKFLSGQETFLCLGCHDNFLASSVARNEQDPNPLKMAMAEELRRQGNEAYEKNAYKKAIQFYSQSIQECPRPSCLVNRAQANMKLGRFPLAYVDANEALMLESRNEKAKMLRVGALKWIKEEASSHSWPTNLRISMLLLANEEYLDENLVGLSPEYVECRNRDQGGEAMQIPLHKLDKFLNEHVQGAVQNVLFEFVKFTEPMVQMLRRVKRERFEHVDEEGKNQFGLYWLDCDFSGISGASFRFLLDELFCPAYIYIAEWIGMPPGFNHNTLFTLKAFRDAENIDYYKFGKEIDLNSTVFNLHLDSDMLIDFLHSPGLRRLNLIDGQLQDGFDPILDRLIERFNQDTQSRSYVLVILVLNATKKTKERLKIGKTKVLRHPKNLKDMLKCTLTKATGVHFPIHGSLNTDNMFQFKADRY